MLAMVFLELLLLRNIHNIHVQQLEVASMLYIDMSIKILITFIGVL